MKIFQYLVAIGVRPQLPAYVQHRIRLANIVSLVGIPNGTLFLVYYWLYFPPLVPYLTFSLAVLSSVILLNGLGWNRLARTMLSMIFILLLSFIQGYAVQKGEIPHHGILVYTFAITNIPWLVIDLRERLVMGIAFFINAVVMLNQPFFIDYLETNHSRDLFHDPIFNHVLLFSALIIGGFLLWFLNYRTLLSEKSNALLLEDVSTKNEKLQSQQEVMEKHLRRLQEKQKEEKQRIWHTQTLNRLNRLLQDQYDSPRELYHLYLSELAQRCDIQQALLYLWQEENGISFLNMEGAYAPSQERILHPRIEPGIGLVGQVAQEMKTISLHKLPADYLKINSGLGEASPQSLVVVPALFQDSLQAVAELASLKNLEMHHIELIEEAMAPLAAWIFNQKVYRRTQSLLHTSQQQAEALRAQEEEMRQNLEELEATQEEMRRREEEYRKIIDEMRHAQANAQDLANKASFS
ncbi:MAG: GAF domain-containing protein [Microscillaceae bacterium]|nr:GAF domain-containing protein [Microscillaceae bacterium]